jgi:MFS transporter, DHA1 family, tetracycline resistance protein
VALSGISLIAPIVGALVVSGVTLLLTIILLDETLTPERRLAKQAAVPDISVVRLLTSRPVVLVLGTAFIIGLYVATVFSSFSLYAERVLFSNQPAEVIIQNVNFIIMMLGLAAAISQIFLIAPLVRRWSEPTLVVIGSVLLLGSAIGISSGSLGLVLVSVLAYALGFAMSWPSLQAIMTRLSSKETLGRQLGLVQSVFSLAFILAPLAAGFLLEAIGPQAIFYNGALLMVLATFLGVIILHLPLPTHVDGHIRGETPSAPRGMLERFHH